MTAVIIIVAVILVLLFLYVLSLKGRNGKIRPELLKVPFAHRGLHKDGVPENSMAAFKAAKEKGYGVELDVHLTADGGLAVIHDCSLKRTVGEDINIYEVCTKDLEKFNLEGTDQTIPAFKDVLALFDAKVPIIVELKSDKGNASELCRRVTEELDGYKGEYCIESFDPRCVMWFKKNRPDIIRGQLSQNFFKKKYGSFVLSVLLTSLVMNFLTKPDFVAFNYEHKSTLPFLLYTRVWKGLGVVWTIRTKQDFDSATKDGYLSIFENFEP